MNLFDGLKSISQYIHMDDVRIFVQRCEDVIKILETFPNSNDLYVDFVLTNNKG